MSQIDALTNTTATSVAGSSALEDLDLDVFLELMLQELQNQDPLDPMDNQELINSISQIREISANDRLTETLDSVLLGQNVATATSLIGTEVEALTDSGQRVTGAVRQVYINDGQPELELAVETYAEAGDSQGSVEAGEYSYEVVWETEDGVFGVQVAANTEDFGEDFNGSIRLDNLPVIDAGVTRHVYRSVDGGEPMFVGSLIDGSTTAFTDTLATDQIGPETLSGQRTVLRYADAVTVRLNNVGTIQTLD